MATLTEANSWEAGIYQLELTDPVVGGADGLSNLQAKQLANRTLYLKGLVEALGTGKQPLDATLTALAGLVTAANQMIYSTAPDTFATTSLSAFIRTLLDDVDAAAARTTLGAAPLASPALTGTPTAPTAALGTNTTQVATMAAIQAAIANLLDSAPGTLNTLNELAAALGDDPNFATTMTNALAGKQPLDATLTALAGVVSAANQLIYSTGADAFSTTTLSAFIRTLLDDADAAAARATLGAAQVPDVMIVRDEKPNGTPGGTFTSGAWRTRDFNTVLVNSIAGASLAGNQIILPAGRYEIEAETTCYTVYRARAALYNVTSAEYTAVGLSVISGYGSNAYTAYNVVSSVVELAAPATFELRHRCETTGATDGLGFPSSFGVPECYSQITIRKVA